VIPGEAVDGGISDGASGVVGNGIREGDEYVTEDSGSSLALGVWHVVQKYLSSFGLSIA